MKKKENVNRASAITNTGHQTVDRCLTIHSPDLDLPVIGSRHDERHAGVEGGPVDPPVVTLDTKIQSHVTQIQMK